MSLKMAVAGIYSKEEFLNQELVLMPRLIKSSLYLC
jgi:hypothetical protein